MADVECIDLVESDMGSDSDHKIVEPKKRQREAKQVRQNKKTKPDQDQDQDPSFDSDHSVSSDSVVNSSDDDFLPDKETAVVHTSSRRVRHCREKSKVVAQTRQEQDKPKSRRRQDKRNGKEEDDADTLADESSSLRFRIRFALQAKEVMSEAEHDGDSDSEEEMNRNIKSTSTSPEMNRNIKSTSTSNNATLAAKTSYLKSLQTATEKRSYPLCDIPKHQTIATGRTIKPLRAWGGHWPPLREFMQNTIDHLGLMDGKTGRRRSIIDLRVTKGNEVAGVKEPLAKFEFLVGDEDICTITAAQDELIITQRYTFPIASRALDTGVPDTTKGMASSNQAGGFGDGFKTAAVALLANTKEFSSLKWYFNDTANTVDGQSIVWAFEGLTRQSIGTFAKCQVLQVRVVRIVRVRVRVKVWVRVRGDFGFGFGLGETLG
jgi:hypothetical protein